MKQDLKVMLIAALILGMMYLVGSAVLEAAHFYATVYHSLTQWQQPLEQSEYPDQH